MPKQKMRSATRRRRESLVRIHVVVPTALDSAARELAAVRRQSLAALHTEALRDYLAKTSGADDAGSGHTLIVRQLLRTSRKQDIMIWLLRVIGETLGQILILLLGSLKHPSTPQEKKQFEEQAGSRLPHSFAAIADGLETRDGAFLSHFVRETIAKEEDFPKPQREESPHDA